MRRLAAALACAAGVGGSACHRAADQERATTAPVSVSVQTARLDTLRDAIVVPGNVVPVAAADWTVYAPETGRIAEMPKMEGEAVKTGDVLVRFDIASLSADLANTQLEVSSATSRVSAAKADVARMTSLFERGFTSRNDFEASKAALVAAESGLSKAETAQAAATALADRAVVKARFDGVVMKRWHNEGDFVNAAVNDAVMRVIDPTRVQVAVQVSTGQLGRIAVGQTATVSTIGAATAEPATVVTQPVTVDSSAASQEVRVSLAGKTALTVGMLVQVEILLDQRVNAVLVPSSSIVSGEDGTFVMIAGDDGRAHRRDVRVGLYTKALSEIVSGVTAGDKVIVTGLKDVTDGAPIVIDR
jgi:RND family efflux transporter MFP subunit